MNEELIERYKQLAPDFDIEQTIKHAKKIKSLTNIETEDVAEGSAADFNGQTIKNALRINTLTTTESEAVKRLMKKDVKLEKIGFLDKGYYYETPFTLSSMQEYLQGHIYIQDAASQLAAEILDPKPGEKVLDLCAAPGSKTTQLAAMMQNTGVIVSVETMPGRITALKNNIERCSVKNCIIFKKDAKFAKELGAEFDKILLDAPCSGNYTQNEDWLSKRTVDDFKSNARTQKEMIKSAFKVLKKRGVIVYSTCSLEPEENELVVQWAINNLDLEIEDTNKKIGDPGIVEVFGEKLDKEISKCLRIWPHRTGMQGFFIAKMRKE